MQCTSSSWRRFNNVINALLACAGPAADMAPLLEALKAEGVFVREVDTLGIAYHSPALEAFSAELRAGAGNHNVPHMGQMALCCVSHGPRRADRRCRQLCASQSRH